MSSPPRNSGPAHSPTPTGGPSSSPPPRERSPSTPPGFTPTPSQSAPPGGDATVAESAPPGPGPASPRTVGKYTILEEVQSGGMGVVYRAHDPELNRTVALKMIKAGVLASAEEVARFRREAQAAAALDHQHIIPVYETGQYEGCLYFTMPFAAGGSLAQHQGRFIADPRAAVALLEQVARAVEHAHGRGVLHRDLKPANILLDERGSPWVGDFGLAKLVDASLELTEPGQAIGTPAYMAPEQAGGASERVGPATDVWALGVILYELLTGRRPFEGGTREERLRRVLTAEPPRPRAGKRPLDRGLEAVLLKCLEKEPSRRYASAGALADDLGRWLRGEPVAGLAPWPARAWRALRRYHPQAVRVGVAAVLFVLLALVWRGLSSPAPRQETPDPRQQQALQEELDQLAAGKRVTLIGESGPPAWSRWEPRRMDARTTVDLNGVFRVQAMRQPGLLELLPSAPRQYVLRAQVQQSEGSDSSEVGLYVAHGRRPTEGGTTHTFFKLTFSDRGLGPQSLVRLTLPVYQETPDSFHLMFDATCGVSQTFAPAGRGGAMPWRDLAVEVTPERIRPFWGEQELKPCDPQTALRLAVRGLGNLGIVKDRRPDPLVKEAEPALGEGLGLYVDKGAAAFRSVAIEPLPQK